MLRNVGLFNILCKNTCLKRNILRNYVWTSDKIARSPYKDVDIPKLTVTEYVWRDLEKWSNKTAVVCGLTNRSYTYEQVYRKSRIFGANLRKKFKIQDGDTVGVMLPNVPEYPIACFGILEAGGIVTTLNPVYTVYEVQRQILLSDPKVVIANRETAATMKEAIIQAKKDIPIIVLNVNEPLPESTVSFFELIDGHVDLSVLKDVRTQHHDVSFLPYSSGTTGLPKGVQLTHRNIIANCQQQNTDCRQYEYTTKTHQDMVIQILPMFHSYGLSIIMLHKMTVGLKIVTLPRFHPDTFLKCLLDFKCDLLYLAPPMVLFLGSHPNSTASHFERVRSATSGAAPIPEIDIQNFIKKSGREIQFYQGYGLTETSPLATVSKIGSKNYLSVGHPLPNMQMRVVDEKLNNLGPNEVGELLMNGPNIMKGYKNNPEANNGVFVGDGWFRSGDLAKISEDGEVTIADRLKELIKVKGYQVPPAELENIIKEHPAVHDVGVVGVPDPVTGERPKAFVVLKNGVNADDKSIMEFVHSKVAPYKKIKEICFIKSIPKNPSGKILRRTLKEL